VSATPVYCPNIEMLSVFARIRNAQNVPVAGAAAESIKMPVFVPAASVGDGCAGDQVSLTRLREQPMNGTSGGSAPGSRGWLQQAVATPLASTVTFGAVVNGASMDNVVAAPQARGPEEVGGGATRITAGCQHRDGEK